MFRFIAEEETKGNMIYRSRGIDDGIIDEWCGGYDRTAADE